MLLVEDAVDKMLGHVRNKHDAKVALTGADLTYDAGHLRFLEAYIDPRLVYQVQELNECLSAEGVALRRNGKVHAILGVLLAVIQAYLSAALDERGDHGYKAAAVICERHAAVRAVEHRYAELLFDLGYRS